MIIGYIKGGLANQMFQYAFYKTIAEINNYNLLVDLNFWTNDPNKLIQWNVNPKKTKVSTFKLSVFNIDLNIKSKHDAIDLFKKKYPFYNTFLLRKIYNQIEKIKPYHKRIYIKQKHACFDKKLLKIGDNSHLTGFFQHYQYLDLNRNAILKCFQLKKEFQVNEFLNLKNEFLNCNSVALHIRRGDYVKLGHSCSAKYYNNAISHIDSKVKNPFYYVFSDDLSWCKKNLSFKCKAIYIDYKYNLEDYHELLLMKYCKHNIISNSSFSWWGAWLNENPKKIVIYPDKIKKTLNKDLCVEGWIELKN